jgi:adenylate cyclase
LKDVERPRWLERRWVRLVRGGGGRPLGVLLLVLLASALLAPKFQPFHQLRLANFDQYQALAPRQRGSMPVVIVAIDDTSLRRHGQWPWPRGVLARLVTRIAEDDPAVIGLDIVMSEPDRLSPELLRELAPQIGTDLIERLGSNDAVLAAALRKTRTVLGVAGLNDEPSAMPRGGWAPMLTQEGLDPKPFVRHFKGALRSLVEIDQAARGRGLLNPDAEGGVVRRVPLVAAVGDTLVPGFATELLRVGTHQQTIAVHATKDGVRAIGVGDLQIPTEKDGMIWVHYSRPDENRFVSAADVLAGKIAPDSFARKIVIVGATAVGFSDYHATPVANRMAGVEIHAQAIENIFDGMLLIRPAWARWAEAGVFVLFAAFVILVVPSLKRRYSLIVFGGAVAAAWTVGFMLYRDARLLVDVVSPTIALGGVFAVMVGVTLAEVESNRHALRRQLQREREAAARIAGEFEAARRIQMGSLPQPADLAGNGTRFDVHPFIEPARVVGGDFYDFFAPSPHQLFFALGDVAGKGLAGCLFMAVSKALYKSTALRLWRGGLAAIMSEANREISRANGSSLFVTLFAGILDADTGALEYGSAGHEEPYILHAGRVLRQLPRVAGPPLCVIDDFAYDAGRFQLEPGDTLCLMTDGVLEATNAGGELYGRARLERLLRDLAAASSATSTMAHAIAADVARFAGGAEPADDLAILLLRWTGPAGATRAT